MQSVCFALFLILASMFMNRGFAATQIEVTVNSGRVIDYNNFSPAFVLQGDIQTWSQRSALRELASDANFKLVRVFSDHLLAPCTYWYESTKTGSFNWADVDLLIQRIFAIGAEPFITIGFYNWERESIVTPRGMAEDPKTGLPYPDSWGAYCAEWVGHFKSVGLAVKYYEIINEPHHYFGWGPDADRAKLGYFIDVFNAAAQAMRAENPNILIGNDNSIMKLVLDYFIDYGEDLDFLSYHSYGAGSLSATDDEILTAAETKFLTESETVYGVDRARELYREAKGVDLPVINSENNANFYYTRGTDPRIQQMLGAVYTALCARTFTLMDISYNLYYTFGGSGSSSVNFGMVDIDNNKPWYPYYAQKMIGQNLAAGDRIVESTSSSTNVRVLAWINNEKLNILLICKSESTQTVRLEGVSSDLTYEKIDNTISWRTPAVQTGTIDPAETIVMNGYTVMLLQGEVSAPPPPSVFDDGFESGDFSKWTGTTTSSGESALVVDTLPHHGNRHGQFTSNGSSDSEHAYCYKMIDKEELYARGYLYVAGDLPLADDEDRFYFLRFRANDQSITGAGIRRNGSVDSWILYTRNGSDWIGPFYAPSPVVGGYRWYCVELYWKKASSYGLVEMYVDGEKVLEVTDIDTADSGNVDEVDFGLVSATNVQNRLTVYGDCFALSDAYIGPETDFFEDDFESGDFSEWTGISTTSGENATVGYLGAHHGTFCGRFTSNGDSEREQAYCYKAIDQEETYARGYFYITRGLPLSDDEDRLYFLRLTAGGQSLVGAGIRRNGGVDRWVLYARNSSGWVEPVYATSPAIQTCRWYCIELHWKQHPSQGLAEMYVNGKKVLRIEGIDTTYFGNADTIDFGLISATNVQEHVLDELVVYADCFTLSNVYIGRET